MSQEKLERPSPTFKNLNKIVIFFPFYTRFFAKSFYPVKNRREASNFFRRPEKNGLH